MSIWAVRSKAIILQYHSASPPNGLPVQARNDLEIYLNTVTEHKSNVVVLKVAVNVDKFNSLLRINQRAWTP